MPCVWHSVACLTIGFETEFPIESRILAVPDAFRCMTSRATAALARGAREILANYVYDSCALRTRLLCDVD